MGWGGVTIESEFQKETSSLQNKRLHMTAYLNVLEWHEYKRLSSELHFI